MAGLVLVHYDVNLAGEPFPSPRARIAPFQENMYAELCAAVLEGGTMEARLAQRRFPTPATLPWSSAAAARATSGPSRSIGWPTQWGGGGGAGARGRRRDGHLGGRLQVLPSPCGHERGVSPQQAPPDAWHWAPQAGRVMTAISPMALTLPERVWQHFSGTSKALASGQSPWWLRRTIGGRRPRRSGRYMGGASGSLSAARRVVGMVGGGAVM